jgi:hypothetical protein
MPKKWQNEMPNFENIISYIFKNHIRKKQGKSKLLHIIYDC